MANINIKFNNKDYLLSCDDGQEESLKNLTKFLDRKYGELKEKLGNIGDNKLLLITTIQLIDEYFDLKQRVAQQKKKIDEVAKKFQELRELSNGIHNIIGDRIEAFSYLCVGAITKRKLKLLCVNLPK